MSRLDLAEDESAKFGDDLKRPGKRFRILAVDDDRHVRRLIAGILERQGYEIQTASNGEQTLTLLGRERFDLVLSDIVMPGLDGLELLSRIRGQYPQLPVAMVTAVHDISVAIDAMRRGACDYLMKPFDREQLLKVVAHALQRRQEAERNWNYRQGLEKAVEKRTEMLCQAIEELEHSYDVTLEALGDALDLKDSETEGHSKRVTAYTIALARAMGVASDELKVIARGAFLHDIGKMAVPDGILRKPARLTPEEQRLMQEHCAQGYLILRKIPFLAGAARIVLAHQEHWDGSGYPNRTQGDSIPLGARIFAVADALDAITSDRPYRKARDFSQAQAEIRRCAGTQFDPRVVEVFLRIPIELWTELRSEITAKSSGISAFQIITPA